jgi:hypothetical protein
VFGRLLLIFFLTEQLDFWQNGGGGIPPMRISSALAPDSIIRDDAAHARNF